MDLILDEDNAHTSVKDLDFRCVVITVELIFLNRCCANLATYGAISEFFISAT